ncbi:MAG: response regulator [Candidatus Tectimicrobiota bacterium]
MHTPPCLLVVDDQPMNVDILCSRLAVHGYEILTAHTGEEALTLATTRYPDLLLLDVMLPTLDGLAVCRQLKAEPSLPFLPILMVSAKSTAQDIIAGLEAGADDYVTKPVDQAVLVARVQAMLRLKARHDTVAAHATQLAAQAAHLDAWARLLAQRMQEQVPALERLGRLKQFVAPPLAELVVAAGGEPLLQRHQQEVTVVWCALQGFTPFAEGAAPADVVEVLRNYHTVMGDLIRRFEGTLAQCTGDRLQILLNAPLPCPDPAVRAVYMAVAMQQQLGACLDRWRHGPYGFDLGVGIAQGEALLGLLGFVGRLDYTVLGPVPALAARLCEAAHGGQILLCPRVGAAVEGLVPTAPAGALSLQGRSHPVEARQVLRGRPPEDEAS